MTDLKTKFNKEELETLFKEKGLRGLTKGQKIVAAKLGIIPVIRSERERQLRSRYGLTLEDYDTRLASQDNKCAICKEKWNKDYYVDHNHDTQQVRGLLCARCNTLVGYVERNLNLLSKVNEYLVKYKQLHLYGKIISEKDIISMNLEMLGDR